MKEYYKVAIMCTGKSLGGKDDYVVFDSHTETFQFPHQVAEYLQNAYGNCKRVKTYIDTDKGSEHSGYVYCFHNDDMSHYPVQKWLQQDWIEITHISESPALGSFPRRQRKKVTL